MSRPGPGRHRHQEGFTILEMVIAAGILMIAMSALMLLFTTSLAQSSDARQRQIANSLLIKTMEQARALPYAQVALGLNASASTGDPNITYCTGAGAPASACVDASTWLYKGERIPHGTGMATVKPLNVPLVTGQADKGHRQFPTVNRTNYTVAVYPTFTSVPGAPTDQPVYRLTTVVSWLALGKTKTVTSQSIVYSPSGCMSTTTHPFGAPCQPFFYGTASTGLGAIQVISSDPNRDAVDGIPLETAQISLSHAGTRQDVEQITRLNAGANSTSVLSKLIGSDPRNAGGDGAAALADTDPSSQATQFFQQTFTGTAGTLTENGSGNSLWATSSNEDTGAAAAAATASSVTCENANGTTITGALPCGSSRVQQKSAAVIGLDVNWGGHDWGTTEIARLDAAPAATRTNVSRWGTSGGAACTATSGVGCIQSAATRAIGRLSIGGLPTGFVNDGRVPGAAWAGYLFQLDNYGDSVRAESGISGAAPTVRTIAATGTGQPTLKYWNGTAYSTITWPVGSVPPTGTITLPTTSVDDDRGGGAKVTVVMNGTITLGTQAVKVTGPVGCATICSSTATANSPILADITYTVYKGGDTLATLGIHVDLGKLEATAQYQAAPSAG